MPQHSYCFDINPQWGSHAPVLEAALLMLAPGSLVIEHGAGMFSSPIIARYPVSVLCIEEVPGWRAWAQWLYAAADRLYGISMLSRAKAAIPQLSRAQLVFVDGAARERGDLLSWALSAEVPCVIAHDTEGDTNAAYGYSRHLFAPGRYQVVHDGEQPRTTMWELSR